MTISHSTKTIILYFFNDPYAGSPTKTLLRLILPLNVEIYIHFLNRSSNLEASSIHSIGRSDGRCVQRAGTYSTLVDDKYLQGIPRS